MGEWQSQCKKACGILLQPPFENETHPTYIVKPLFSLQCRLLNWAPTTWIKDKALRKTWLHCWSVEWYVESCYIYISSTGHYRSLCPQIAVYFSSVTLRVLCSVSLTLGLPSSISPHPSFRIKLIQRIIPWVTPDSAYSSPSISFSTHFPPGIYDVL